MGDSLTAGFTNGSLVFTHQQFSWPALLARQTGTSIASFQQPYITRARRARPSSPSCRSPRS